MYPVKTDPKTTAKVCGRNLRVSTKHSIEVGRFIKGTSIEKAKRYLKNVAEKKRAIPFRRFNSDLAHKKEVGPGRYPVIVSNKFIELLNSAEQNAEYKGLDTKKLVIRNVSVNKGVGFHRPRRSVFRGQTVKSTNISIIVEESK